MNTPLIKPHPIPTNIEQPMTRLQCTLSAMSWVATVVDQTVHSATIAPTDKSIPPPVITNVIPMLTTPITEASRRISMMFSLVMNVSGAEIQPSTTRMASATINARLRHSPVSRDPPPVSAAARSIRRDSSAGGTSGVAFVSPLTASVGWVMLPPLPSRG